MLGLGHGRPARGRAVSCSPICSGPAHARSCSGLLCPAFQVDDTGDFMTLLPQGQSYELWDPNLVRV